MVTNSVRGTIGSVIALTLAHMDVLEVRLAPMPSIFRYMLQSMLVVPIWYVHTTTTLQMNYQSLQYLTTAPSSTPTLPILWSYHGIRKWTGYYARRPTKGTNDNFKFTCKETGYIGEDGEALFNRGVLSTFALPRWLWRRCYVCWLCPTLSAGNNASNLGFSKGISQSFRSGLAVNQLNYMIGLLSCDLQHPRTLDILSQHHDHKHEKHRPKKRAKNIQQLGFACGHPSNY